MQRSIILQEFAPLSADGIILRKTEREKIIIYNYNNDVCKETPQYD